MEIWKDIPNYEGLYEASSLGNIRSKAGKTTSSARYPKRVWKQREIKQKYKKTKSGRVDAMVCLWKNRKPYYHLVSRLVASAFIEDMLFSEMTVNHINGNPLDNSCDNLEWITRAENIKYGFDNGQYRRIMKKIILSRSGEVYELKSTIDSDRFLGRYRGYTSRTIKNGSSNLIDKDGNIYSVNF